jgi:hypothetical protein
MDKKPLIFMIVFGLVRAALAWASGYVAGHGWIDADTHQRLLSEGTANVASFIVGLIPVVWTVLQKTQVWGWMKTRMHFSSSTTPADIITVAPGPNQPI